MNFKNTIKITEDIRNDVQKKGKTWNEAISAVYGEEISAIKKAHDNLKDCSPTKIAILSAGITGNDIVNSMFTTDDNRFLFPAYMSELVDKTVMKTPILDYLIGGTSGTDYRTVTAPILDMLDENNAKKVRTARVAEGAETSYRTIGITDGTFKLNKKMIGSRITYEAMREMKIDLWSRIVTALTTDIARQNVADVIKTIQAAESVDLLTTQTANTITNAEFVKATTEYLEAFGEAPDIIVTGKDMYNSIAQMGYDSSTVFGVNSRMTISLPQLKDKPITVVKGDNMAQVSSKNVAVMYSKTYAPQRWTQTGSSLTEYDTNVLNQTQTVVISEISGYSNLVKQYGLIKSA